MEEIKKSSKRPLAVIILVVVLIAGAVGVTVYLQQDGKNSGSKKSEQSAGQVDDTTSGDNAGESQTDSDSPEAVASLIDGINHSVHIELFTRFKDKDSNEFNFPDEYCGSYMDSKGYHIVLTSLDDATIKQFDDLFANPIYCDCRGYENYVFYEKGTLSYKTMYSYAKDMADKLAEKELYTISYGVNTFELNVYVETDVRLVDQTREYIESLIDAGEYEGIDKDDFEVREQVIENTPNERYYQKMRIESGICINDYVKAEITSLDSKSIEFTLEKVKDFDLAEGCDGLACDGEYITQSPQDEFWVDVYWLNELTGDDIETDFTSVAIGSQPESFTVSWTMFGELPSGHYRIIKPVYATKNGSVDAEAGKYYIAFEFDI